MRSLLICGAHPDDETFFAGTMAKYASEGVRVSVLCGTRGERGNTAGLCSIEELPKLREAELRDSMRVLGLRDENVFFLPYEDRKLHLASPGEVRELIVKIVRLTRPQVVITFDPHGANGHTDHAAMSRFVADAVSAAADARSSPGSGEAWVVSRFLWQPPQLPWRTPPGMRLEESFGTDFLIDTKPFADKKRDAILRYRTQLPGLEHLFLERGSPGLTLYQEAFRQGWGPRPGHVPSSDLFEGL